MPRKLALLNVCLATLACCLVARAAEQWTDTQGNSFKGEPTEVLGPFALFRTGPASGSKPAWRFLKSEDCVRFYEKIKNNPARAADWSQAKSLISRQLIDKVKQVRDDKLVDAVLKDRPEPEFYLVLFADAGEGKPWEMLSHSIDPFNKLQALFPGQIEGLFFGIQHSATDHNSMATRLKMPWLVAEYREQFRHMPEILGFAPTEGGEYAIMVVSRDGVPVLAAQSPTDADLGKFFAELAGILDLLRPENPRGWPDELHYRRSIQPVVYPHGHGDPVLIGSPLVASGLRQRKIYNIAAKLAVSSEGHVTDVTMLPGNDVSANMVGPLSDALKKTAVFVPAIEEGKFVDGTFEYHLQLSH